MISQKFQDNLFGHLGTSFKVLCEYLTMNEKIKLSSTCNMVRSILLSGKVWGEFYISNGISIENWNTQLKWMQKYITKIQPFHLQILIRDLSEQEVKKSIKIFTKKMSFVKQIDLYCQSICFHLILAQCCPIVERISLRSSVLSDSLLEQMCKQMKDISELSIIKDDLQFTCSNFVKYINSNLRKLVLKPHALDFYQLKEFVKSAKYLEELQIDVQECEETTLIQIIGELSKIQKLRIYHMENMKDDKLLSEMLTPNIRQLLLTKTYNLPMGRIVTKIASQNLVFVDLTEALQLKDENLIFLAKKSPNLRHVNVSWCTNIKNQGVKIILCSCLKIQNMILNGLKQLNDIAFSQYSELLTKFNQKYFNEYKSLRQKANKFDSQENEKLPCDSNSLMFKDLPLQIQDSIITLRNLKYLQCNSCNNVSDKLLKVISCLRRRATVINYYGNNLGIYSSSGQDDSF